LRKVVVYGATRDWYDQVLPSIKSLLYHNDIDKVYLLTETDGFPYVLPENVQTVNVKRFDIFSPDGPNINTRYSIMAMMRGAFTKILPDETLVLSLDADTIVLDDISELFETDMTDYYVAGAKEPHNSRESLYINAGVMLMNLEKLRDGTDDKLIAEMNTVFHDLVEQDCINRLCTGHILEISGAYNASQFTICNRPAKIRHWAADHRTWQNDPLVKPYRELYFDEIQNLKDERMKTILR